MIEYAVNESGGRVTVRAPSPDPGAVAALHLELLEAAAAIRRGDLGRSKLFPLDSPALADLARSRDRIRCTFRPTPRGGELVLLSDDDRTVAAIHRLLSERPPRPGRGQSDRSG